MVYTLFFPNKVGYVSYYCTNYCTNVSVARNYNNLEHSSFFQEKVLKPFSNQLLISC